MNETKREKTREFVALGHNGKIYRVVEYTNFVNARTMHDDQDVWVPGIKSLRLADGDPINMISEGVYEIARTRERLKLKP